MGQVHPHPKQDIYPDLHPNGSNSHGHERKHPKQDTSPVFHPKRRKSLGDDYKDRAEDLYFRSNSSRAIANSQSVSKSREKLWLKVESLLITSETRLSPVALRNRQRIMEGMHKCSMDPSWLHEKAFEILCMPCLAPARPPFKARGRL
jgi:hypothetical protein